jgi:hypothetical protein
MRTLTVKPVENLSRKAKKLPKAGARKVSQRREELKPPVGDYSQKVGDGIYVYVDKIEA